MRALLAAVLLTAGAAGAVRAGEREEAADIERALKALRSPDAKVRTAAAEELHRVRRLPAAMLAPLFAAAKDKDATVRAEAVNLLGLAVRGTAGLVAALTEAAKDPELPVRFAALYGLGRQREDARPAVPVLQEMVKKDESPQLRDLAWTVLEEILGPSEEKGGDGAMFGVGGPEGIKSIAFVIDRGERMATHAEATNAEIERALDGLSRKQRFMICWPSVSNPQKTANGLVEATAGNKFRAIQVIRWLFERKEDKYRGIVDPGFWILDVVEALHPDAIIVVSATDIDADKAAAITAKNAGKTSINVVGFTDTADGLKNLAKVAADNKGKFRAIDTRLLAVFGPAALADDKAEPRDKRLARLLADLKSPEAGVRRTAAGALCMTGPADKSAVAVLAAALADADEGVRLGAAGVLEQIGKDAEPAAEKLAAALDKDASEAVRDAAWNALERIHGGGPKAPGAGGAVFGANGPERPKTVVYVIDRAGWMKPVAAAVDAEVTRAVGTLGRGQRFAAVWVCDGFTIPGEWHVERATADNRKRALRDLDAIPAKGRSNRLKALLDALECGPDAVYFVTGVELDAKAVAEVTAKNAGKASINVVTFYEKGDPPEKNLAKLASDNGGKFVGVEMKAAATKKN